MKQLLLRVSDDTHARLHQRARGERRSINALLGEVLDVVATTSPGTPHGQLKVKAAALGVLGTRASRRTEESTTHHSVDMDHIARLTAGWGAQVDAILAEDRERA